jgi:hypothetical protein
VFAEAVEHSAISRGGCVLLLTVVHAPSDNGVPPAG